MGGKHNVYAFHSFSRHICSDRKVKTLQFRMCSLRHHSLVLCGMSVCDRSVTKWTDTLCLDTRMQRGCRGISSAGTPRIQYVFYFDNSQSACVLKPSTIAKFSQSSVTCGVIIHSVRSQCVIMRVHTYISSTWWRRTVLGYGEWAGGSMGYVRLCFTIHKKTKQPKKICVIECTPYGLNEG